MIATNLNQIETFIENSLVESFKTPNVESFGDLINIHSIGIIGAGTMGGGIAMNFANVGLPVTIIETNETQLAAGLERVRVNYQRSADRGRFPQKEVQQRMNLINGGTTLSDLSGCDLIIEAVFENIEIKKQIFSELDKIAKPNSILATNTSGLDINSIASMTSRPEDVIGLHFFSPANVMKLLEIVQAKYTKPIIIRSCMEIAKKINKIPVLVGVCDGFVGNRILWARQSQAMRLVGKGVMPWDIDKALNDFGFKMGPFQMSDLAGLDLGWSKGVKTNNPIKDALCELGRRGQKTLRGYYDYDGNRTPIPSKETEKVIKAITNVDQTTMPKEKIIETLVYPMINEALQILHENKAQRPSDIDVVWLFGYGWPRSKGGLMFYADQIGAANILQKMNALSLEDRNIKISNLLFDVVRNNGKFLDIDSGGLIAT
ncbi:MAG: 3-hydroxyacyl-CoA dehydrogenase [Rhodobacteraceae bacterium]|nr:3-hydroxyacyl-CoA dehydrogenase [Paracoccaceae bacterium]MBT4776718.1 3-hydroxyacyl-CoA dehydrogenase [Paracoccaceae bacterium]MBT6270749.1 3-hydroxyacyl-CoA dehydrogenase [Paracoccaceae bacterium]